MEKFSLYAAPGKEDYIRINGLYVVYSQCWGCPVAVVQAWKLSARVSPLRGSDPASNARKGP